MPTERLRLYLDERGIKSNANFFKLWVFFQDLSKKCSIPRTLGIHVVFLEHMLLPTVLIDSFNKNYALILSRLTLAFFCFLRLFFFLLNLCLIKVKKNHVLLYLCLLCLAYMQIANTIHVSQA